MIIKIKVCLVALVSFITLFHNIQYTEALDDIKLKKSTKSIITTSRPESLTQLKMKNELTEEQKKKIRLKVLEEIYRKEQLKSLEQKTLFDRTYTFLNSSLGLWILSSLLLGSFTALWKLLQSARDESLLVQEKLNRISIEVTSRFEKLEDDIEKWSNYRETHYTSLVSIITEKSESLLPDFQDRNAKSILIEAKLIVNKNDKKRKKDIKNLIEQIEQIEQLVDQYKHGQYEHDHLAPDQLCLKLKEKTKNIIEKCRQSSFLCS